jgi:CRP/FNR family cyclic AMP-dependent transcriptional regulator
MTPRQPRRGRWPDTADTGSGRATVESARVLESSVFGVLPGSTVLDLAQIVGKSRLLAGHILYDPEVTVLAGGLVRAFISNPTGRQLTVAYIRSGQTLGLAHLAGRRFPTAFQAVEDSRLLVVGNARTLDLQQAHPEFGWAAAGEFALRLDELETELARLAFGSLRQRLAAHLLALTDDHYHARYPVHLSQLAAAVASSREVVHRNLRPLVAEGSLSVGPGGVTVTDRARLRDHANID